MAADDERPGGARAGGSATAAAVRRPWPGREARGSLRDARAGADSGTRWSGPTRTGSTSDGALDPGRGPTGGCRHDEVTDRVLALVAEQTGYPPDLLDLDLDLEADLGIDTVKQAEVFATIREAYGIPFDEA